MQSDPHRDLDGNWWFYDSYYNEDVGPFRSYGEAMRARGNRKEHALNYYRDPDVNDEFWRGFK